MIIKNGIELTDIGAERGRPEMEYSIPINLFQHEQDWVYMVFYPFGDPEEDRLQACYNTFWFETWPEEGGSDAQKIIKLYEGLVAQFGEPTASSGRQATSDELFHAQGLLTRTWALDEAGYTVSFSMQYYGDDEKGLRLSVDYISIEGQRKAMEDIGL